MPPSATRDELNDFGYDVGPGKSQTQVSVGYLLDRDLHKAPREVASSEGSWIILKDGQRIFDATCGAAVSCLGHQSKLVDEVHRANSLQAKLISYCHSLFFSTTSTDRAAEILIEGTGYKMSRAYICGSGSEATESMMKLVMQYFHEIGEPRYQFIAREHSYHGATLGALALSGHVARRKLYEPALMKNVSFVSPCNAYRQRLEGESDASFVARKAAELEQKFADSKERIAAFVCEPVSGAALGCVPYVPGYLAAMKAVCKKYGALFVLDEVMSGMGRCGTLHVWQSEHSDEPGYDCVPDIQMIGKGIASGMMPAAALLLGPTVVDGISAGTGKFSHGQTYQAHPMTCAAIHAVQTIVKRENLLENVQIQGKYLERLLRARLDEHPMVGNIRGKGLFWGIEFVKDKQGKTPFDPSLKVADMVHELALTPKYSMSFYPGQGTVDGVRGDHAILAPAYVVSREEIELIANTISDVIDEVYGTLKARGALEDK